MRKDKTKKLHGSVKNPKIKFRIQRLEAYMMTGVILPLIQIMVFTGGPTDSGLGIMWMMYQETGMQRYAEIARFSEEKMDFCLMDFYGLHHDVGFMYLPTAVADYRITGNLDSRRRALHAANLLAARF